MKDESEVGNSHDNFSALSNSVTISTALASANTPFRFKVIVNETLSQVLFVLLTSNMDNLSRRGVQDETDFRASKRQKGSGHVQNDFNHTLHEASARSGNHSISQSAPSSQPSKARSMSSRPEYFSKNVPQVSRKKPKRSIPPSATSQRAMLPQLPLIPDKSLEEAVFTHQSYLPGHNQEKLHKSYDRLEFLGDAYIEVIASQLVYSMYPHMPAGRLSQQRENLVKNESLAAHSIAYGFDKRVRIRLDVADATSWKSKDRPEDTKAQKSIRSTNASSKNEIQQNQTEKGRPPSSSNAVTPISRDQKNASKKQRTKILGDIFEAYVAAIVLSSPENGYHIAEEWLNKLWIPKLEAQSAAETRAPPPPTAKGELAKRIMGKGIKVEYNETAPPDESESNAGKTWYTMGVFLTGWGWSQTRLGEGRALNKSQAGINAATQALQNPLTEEVSSVKRDFDSAVTRDREAENMNIARVVNSKKDESEYHHDDDSSESDESSDSSGS